MRYEHLNKLGTLSNYGADVIGSEVDYLGDSFLFEFTRYTIKIGGKHQTRFEEAKENRSVSTCNEDRVYQNKMELKTENTIIGLFQAE